MKSSEKRLTTVRIEDKLFQEFKFQCIKDKFSFQKLASRAIYLYLTDKKVTRNKKIEKLYFCYVMILECIPELLLWLER
jgi:hypothetical protein